MPLDELEPNQEPGTSAAEEPREQDAPAAVDEDALATTNRRIDYLEQRVILLEHRPTPTFTPGWPLASPQAAESADEPPEEREPDRMGGGPQAEPEAAEEGAAGEEREPDRMGGGGA